MINEKRIKELEKKLSSPNYSTSLPSNGSTKTDINKLKKLAKEIRKTVEDYTVEPNTHSATGS